MMGFEVSIVLLLRHREGSLQVDFIRGSTDTTMMIALTKAMKLKSRCTRATRKVKKLRRR